MPNEISHSYQLNRLIAVLEFVGWYFFYLYKMSNRIFCKQAVETLISSAASVCPWLIFSARNMSWGPRNPCFTKFSVISFLEMACNQRYPTNIKNSKTQSTRLIRYILTV